MLNNMSKIPLIKNTFYQEEATKNELIKFIKNSKKLSMGSECRNFEQMFSKFQNTSNSLLCNSGSSANLLLIQALLNLNWLKKGDNVAFSAVTWSTNVMPLLQLGLNAIPVDVSPETLNSSSVNLANVISKYNIKAFFITNVLGFCSDLDQINELCNKKNILLLEDNCESFGSIFKGNKLGNYGLASTFSFFVGHHLSAIEGGVVCTKNHELADMLTIVRAHGWGRNLMDDKREKLKKEWNIKSFYDQYTFYHLGYNLRPTEITGFLASNQLKYANEIIKIRQNNFLTLIDEININDEFENIEYDHMDLVSNFAIPVVCKNKKVLKKYVERMETLKIEIRPLVSGNITKQPFFQKYNLQNIDLSGANKIHECGFYIPNNPDLTKEDLKLIKKSLGK